jgi:hypothetical protein
LTTFFFFVSKKKEGVTALETKIEEEIDMISFSLFLLVIRPLER